MSLRLQLQLLAFAALTFTLPWAGLRIVHQMEASLRLGLEQQLLTSAHLIATSLPAGGEPGRRREGLSAPLYVHALSRPPLLDGDQSEWRYTADASDSAYVSRGVTLDDGSRVWLGLHSAFLYLFVEVDDDEVVLQSASGAPPHGDRIALVFEDPDAPAALLLAGSAQGLFSSQPTAGGRAFAPSGGTDDNVRGYWRRPPLDGYAVEARIPLTFVDGARGIPDAARVVADGALGIGIIDSDPGTANLAAATWNDAGRANALVGKWPGLDRMLRPYADSGARFRILDADGWVLADSGVLDLSASPEPASTPSLIERFFRWVLRREDPDYPAEDPGRIGDQVLRRVLDGEAVTAWYRRGSDVSAIVAAAVPVDHVDPRLGAVLVEQASDPILSVTNREMLRLVLTTVVVGLIAAAALLGYASLLRFRLGRLARAAESALGPRGEINARLPGARARDEIGDLSRSFGDLLGRLREYTEYLQTLKSKLSHELRTPLAIVATSLDNLEHEAGTASGKTYLERIRTGSERLESILQAMTAATRVEQAITETSLERFDPGTVVSACVSAYRDVYAGRSFELSLPAGPVLVDGSAELIAQLLDKLIDNAVGFATPGSAIAISLDVVGDEVELAVVNRGPLLPAAMRHRLFDSLVSVREKGDDKPHLGFGLYIVTLVAEFHRGRVEAENLDDGSGVRLAVVLPRADAGAA